MSLRIYRKDFGIPSENHSLAPKTIEERSGRSRGRRVTRTWCQRPTSFRMHQAMTVGVFYWKRWLSVGIINGWTRSALRSFSANDAILQGLPATSRQSLFKLFEFSLYLYVYKRDENTNVHFTVNFAFIYVHSRKLALRLERLIITYLRFFKLEWPRMSLLCHTS